MLSDINNRMIGWLTLGALALMLGAGGCSDKKKRPHRALPAKKASAAANAVALNELDTDKQLAETYIYTPVGKRDPFRSLYKNMSGEKEKPGGPLGPLQKYEIDQLKLIAVITGLAQPKAMVTTPDGKGHVVKLGTRIGKNFGRVARIKNGEVIIAEDYRDTNGRKVTNLIHMAMKKGEKE